VTTASTKSQGEAAHARRAAGIIAAEGLERDSTRQVLRRCAIVAVSSATNDIDFKGTVGNLYVGQLLRHTRGGKCTLRRSIPYERGPRSYGHRPR
jgi:hypothetical protein